MRSTGWPVLAGGEPEVVRRIPGATVSRVTKKGLLLDVDSRALAAQVKNDLLQVGWTKGLELAKLARKQGQRFESATWMHKARELPKEEFRREVERELTGKDCEPSELIYFKVYKSQIPVIEQAIETAALMLGSDKSRGYCIEMICADFIAGANLDDGNPQLLLQSISRYFRFLPKRQQEDFLSQATRSHES